jgi:formyl-CoA transferase
MPGPLAGFTVLDLTRVLAGPFCAYQLALLGAEVIKIEAPEGDETRQFQPLMPDGPAAGESVYFACTNRNKRSVVLDLKTTDGVAALKRLVTDADVLVENFAPGVMDRLGVGEDVLRAINPRLIYASSSGYGRDGPYRDYPAMDLTIQAMCGVMETTGFPDRPPVKAGPAIGDFFAGIHLYGAIVTALFARERTGVAHRAEVAMQDAIYASLSSSLGLAFGAEEGTDLPSRTGNRHGGLAECPYNVYPASDGYIAMICVRDVHWQALSREMERPDLAADPELATLRGRVAQMDRIDALVAEWTAPQTKEALFARLLAAKVPSAPVRTLAEVMTDPNMHARGTLIYQDHPQYGRIVVQQSPMRYAGVDPIEITPSRPLGADNAELVGD